MCLILPSNVLSPLTPKPPHPSQWERGLLSAGVVDWAVFMVDVTALSAQSTPWQVLLPLREKDLG